MHAEKKNLDINILLSLINGGNAHAKIKIYTEYDDS